MQLNMLSGCAKLVPMSSKNLSIVSFLQDLMRRRRLLPSRLATELNISHATVSRWISGADVPSIRSCQKLAEYSGIPLEKVLSSIGYLPRVAETPPEWPEFREYAQRKYPAELDEDLITMIEDLIERRRAKKHKGKQS